MSSVPAGKLGSASAFLATMRNLGLVTGTGLATGLFTWRQAMSGDFVYSLHLSFFVAGLAAIGATLAALGRREKKT